MAFNTGFPEGFPLLYNTEWKLALQQMTARLQPFVNIETIHGKSKRYQRLDKSVARKITVRNGKTNPRDPNTEYRWLDVSFSDCADIVDRIEAMQLGEVGSPHNQILVSQKAAAFRDMDKTLIDGIRGGVRSGETGGTTISLPAGQQIGAGFRYSGVGNTGMTFDKVLECATRFGISQVFGQDVENESQGCLAITARELNNLLQEEKLTNADYGLRRLQEGKVVNLFGLAIKVVDASILPYNATTDIRTCVAWAREHVVFGMGEAPTAFVDVLPEQSHAVQLRTEWGCGATRIADEGVIEIACDLSP